MTMANLDEEIARGVDLLPDDFQIVVTVDDGERWYQVVINDADDVIDPEEADVEEFSPCGGSFVLGEGHKLSVALSEARDTWGRLLELYGDELSDRVST
jgi:hypothetical protein